MGKPANEDKIKDSDTKIVFKRSFNTNFTNSTCFSGGSQLVTKSSFLQIKRNLQNNNSSEGAKVKRDLSIETDACILRRYYKIKRQKMSNQGSSVISKYSTVVDTEIETIEEFPDTSACGDNEMEMRSNRRLDIEALMLDNLKSLMGQWIQTNLLHNKDTQNKLDTVLDSILQKLDNKAVHETSSDSTYIIHKAEKKQAVKNKKIATSSTSCQYCKSCRGKIQSSSTISRKDSSTLTVPWNYKGIRIISTLSVPRSFHKSKLDQRNNRNRSTHKINKIKRKNLIFAIDKPHKLPNASSYDLIAISTKSLIKRCPNCDKNIKKKRHLVLLPKPLFKKSSNSSNTNKQDKTKAKARFDLNQEKLGDISSLLKSLYTTSTDKYIQFDIKHDNFTMTENICEPILNYNISKDTVQNNASKGIIENKTKYTNEDIQNESTVEKDNQYQLTSIFKSGHTERNYSNKKLKQGIKKQKLRNHIPGNKLARYTKSNNADNKRFTSLYKRTNSSRQGREFVRFCHNIFQYFAEHDNNRNINVDVRVNVFPTLEPRTKDVYTDVSNQALDSYNIKESRILIYDEDNKGSTTIELQPYAQPTTVLDIEYERDPTISSSHCTAEIIPILDGAVSQAKYIFNSEENQNQEIKSDIPDVSQLGILQEISELRAVIKELAMTAEKFVNENLKKNAMKSNAETHFSLNMNDNYTLRSQCSTEILQKNPSKTTQISIEFEKIKERSEISKEAKNKDTFDYYNRLTKKSTSYRIIDSESLLKVTDMTSKANEVDEYNRGFADEALTCSLPKSRSLFEMTSDRNKKLIAFFCDNYVNPKVNCQIRDSRCSAPSPCKSSKTSTKSKRWRFWSKKNSKCPSTCPSPRPVPLPMPCTDGGYSSSMTCRSMNSIIDEEDELVCKLQRKGMGFGEGCVYCLLLWIPVIIISIVFYSYVLKDVASNSTDSDSGPNNNTRKYSLKLSDLGF